ncbi:hypothetical protein AACH06_22070 [Ideonella sp. DXS29W]|uniref:Phage protein D n=1 Tax=Ideonella lacteola TaxID=2984193 RepID=A0ABU9BU70_9BURK
MLKGVHLSLLIGPGVPVPAPKAVIEAVQSVQVTSGRDKSGFQITLAVSKKSLLLDTLLPAGFFDPITTRVIIVVTLGGFPHVLMDGVVTQQELSPSNEPGQSTLTITGEDLSVLMDVVELKVPFPQMSDTMQAYAMLAPYAAFGVVPIVIPSFILDIRVITEGYDSQTGTHLERLKYLADANGFVFYVEPGPLPGQSIAYMGPNIRVPVPQPALSVNMDAHTNVESLSFSLDGLAKETMVVTVLDPITKKIPIPLPIPNISIFQPPLGARPTPPAKIKFTNDKAGVGVQRALKTVVGRLLKGSANAITASGSLDVLRYGHVLRSKALVGVRGAGIAYDGLYYVDSVTHNLKRGEFKQSFQLSRDGLISITPKVPV